MSGLCGHLSHNYRTVVKVPLTDMIRNWDYGTVRCLAFNLCGNETLLFAFELRDNTYSWLGSDVESGVELRIIVC